MDEGSLGRWECWKCRKHVGVKVCVKSQAYCCCLSSSEKEKQCACAVILHSESEEIEWNGKL
jgi:hypothetical protein